MFFFFKNPAKIKIIYGITVCNELKELRRLLDLLLNLKDCNDSILILADVTQPQIEVMRFLASYRNNIKIITGTLNNNFAVFKNILIDHAEGDYLFQIDADEYPQEFLIKNIKKIISQKSKYDSFLVPRINIVNGISLAQMQQWQWNINKDVYINYPDYQQRILKLNGKIKWSRPVHEILTGYERAFNLPAESYDYCLYHIKTINTQIKQNKLYDTL